MKNIGKDKSIFIANKLRSELVFNMSTAENNPLTFPEVKTITEGISIQGRKIEDIEQVTRLDRAWREIISQVKSDTFEITKENFIKINSIVAHNEALKVGDFRDGPVSIAGVKYLPPLPSDLDDYFEETMDNFNDFVDIPTKAFSLFLDCARNQFFYDGNKRTAQLMANGFLMSQGYSLLSITPDDLLEYNQKMVDFYETNNKEDMFVFLGKQEVHLGMAALDEQNEEEQLNELLISLQEKKVDENLDQVNTRSLKP